MSWLTRFDEYDGAPSTKASSDLIVPNGLGHGCPAACPKDLRYEGDWYVGVLALPGTEAEFSLHMYTVEPPPIDYGHQCDLSEPECRAPLDLLALKSAAPPRGAAATARGAALGLAAAGALLLRRRLA